MVLMAIPMIFMYEVSIVIARFVNPVAPEEQSLAERADNDDSEHEDEREDAVERDL
jgi:Sec-independent protein secretion pathway component TatC